MRESPAVSHDSGMGSAVMSRAEIRAYTPSFMIMYRMAAVGLHSTAAAPTARMMNPEIQGFWGMGSPVHASGRARMAAETTAV